MKSIRINDYDMRYIEMGEGTPLVLVHGSLSDYRVWSPVLGPLSRKHRVIVPSLRHFFPDHWDGTGGSFTIAQHVSDLIQFIEALDVGAVHLCGHSRGGHISFRSGEQRPDLIRKLILAEPGGTLDPSLAPESTAGAPSFARLYVDEASRLIQAGDVEDGLRTFKDAIDGEGAWMSLPAAERQKRRDNAFTLLAQTNEGRKPYRREEAEAITLPTLFVGGADTQGLLPKVLKALSAHVPSAQVAMIADATHVMFAQQPGPFCDVALAFLADD
jgi:esterase